MTLPNPYEYVLVHVPHFNGELLAFIGHRTHTWYPVDKSPAGDFLLSRQMVASWRRPREVRADIQSSTGLTGKND